jgi:hypothetical protein
MRRIIPLILILLCSCQKVVNLNLTSTPPQLVIEGNITDTPGPDTVKIMRSVNFYADNNFPGVTGATVTISDNTGAKETLKEITPGVYITSTLKGTPGNSYSMQAIVNDTTYAATSTMPQPIELDSVTFLISSTFQKDKITPVANFQDPAGVDNYYRFQEHINGALYTKDFFVFSDRLSDGRYVNLNLRSDTINMYRGDLLQVDLFSVDKNDYNYFFELNQSTGTGTFGGNASPANPATNISNGAYGYFSAHTVRSRTVLVY